VACRTSRSSIGGTDIYHYDNADKLTSVDRVSGTTNYTYDDCGRPTQIGGRTLTWDYEDRMTSYSGYSQSASYSYNGVGSRVTKSGTGGARTYKRDGVGVTAPVLSDGVATMVPGVSERTSGQTNFIHTDRIGSMKGMSNSANVTETAEYDAFGKVIARANATTTQKGFASGFGYQEDGESGYKLLGHRYYDADTGRFLSRDHARDGRNWYVYVSNNPFKGVDPSGLQITYLYKLVDLDTAEILKYGVTWYPATRYSGAALTRMNAKLVVEFWYEQRLAALVDEKILSSEMGGLLNNEPWAYKNRPMIAAAEALTEDQAALLGAGCNPGPVGTAEDLGKNAAANGATRLGAYLLDLLLGSSTGPFTWFMPMTPEMQRMLHLGDNALATTRV